MLRPILKLGRSELSRPAERVADVTADIQALVDDMADTMYAAPGIGLAAPQVGVALRIAVIDLSVGRRGGDLITLINPDWVERSGMQLEDEGCLSVPGFTATVARPARAVVRALDRSGQERVIEGEGLLARALQHEIDHLDGKIFLDRLQGLKRDVIVKKVRKLQRQGKW